jgi:hypothetical protein
MVAGDADNFLLDQMGLDPGAHHLHPRLMYMLFSSYWAGRTGFQRYRSHVELSRFRRVDHPILTSLPERYVAVKFYTRDSFQGTAQNRENVSNFLKKLASNAHVALLNTGIDPDDHAEFPAPIHPNISTPASGVSASENLAIQSAIISRATQVHCTYGGFSYLPMYFGVPVTSYYAGERHYLDIHGPPAFWTAGKLDASFSVIDALNLR